MASLAALGTSRQKTKNLTANAAVALHIQDATNQVRYLELRSDGTIAADNDFVFAERVGAKYGADLRQMDGPGESRVVITVAPTRVHAIYLAAS